MAENETPSNRKLLEPYYEAILDTAQPGDVLFYISRLVDPPKPTIRGQLYRKWKGFASPDPDNWHTAIVVDPKREGSKYKPRIIHATGRGTKDEGSVKRINIPPEYFKNLPQDGKPVHSRLEIVQNPELEKSDRTNIVSYCESLVGRPFDDADRWTRNGLTYLLGIRTPPTNDERVSCHGLAYRAYANVGVFFPHQLDSAPNLFGRIIGHPLGHPDKHVDPSSNYLPDHSIYRDERFVSILAVVGLGLALGQARIDHYPGKYSWDPKLQLAYGFLAI